MVQFYDVALKKQQHVPDKQEGEGELEKSLKENHEIAWRISL